MFPENATASPPRSLFSQMDDVDTSVATDVQFELPQISQPTIEHVINAVADLDHMISMQDVLDTLKNLCTQRVENPEQIEDNVQHFV